MTVKDAAKKYQLIEAEKQQVEIGRQKLMPRCNAVLASIVDESRYHHLEPDEFQKILLALLKNTKFEGAEIINDGSNHRPNESILASAVFELGSQQLSSIELHFSQVVRPN